MGRFEILFSLFSSTEEKKIHTLIDERKAGGQPGGGHGVSRTMPSFQIAPALRKQQQVHRMKPTVLHLRLLPPRMARVLLISWTSCLLVLNHAYIIHRCELAKVLHEQELEGFEGFSLSDCECHFLGPISPRVLKPSVFSHVSHSQSSPFLDTSSNTRAHPPSMN